MSLKQSGIKVILIHVMVLTFSWSSLVSNYIINVSNSQEVKYFDFGDESEKETKQLNSEIDTEWKVDSFLVASGCMRYFSRVIQRIELVVCSKDILEILTPPPENISDL